AKTGVKRTTIIDWVGVLEETLMGKRLPAWVHSKKRRPITAPKFYFFDFALVRSLADLGRLRPGNPSYANGMKSFLHHELKTACDYKGGGMLQHWQSASGFEVAFILDQKIAIDVSPAETPSSDDLKGLIALREEQAMLKHILVCRCDKPMDIDGIEILPIK